MTEFPAELLYTKSHEWVRKEDDDTVTVGVTAHAQAQLGELVYVELPEIDLHVDKDDEVAVVESVKTAADVYAPLTGKIVAVNESLKNEPTLINNYPYTDGWLYRIKIEDETELNGLLSASDYEAETQEDD